ncbi:MAG TPA: DUF2849 domain-containing protein [Polyangiaceae bacterium]|jgi:hypothetical protein|nr:DUF2849 domain-containing protein [Polyangiaceae bacterium]
MAKSKGTHFIVTANVTDSGSPTYLTANGGWSPSLADARCIESETEAAGLVEHANVHQQRLVADPYSIMVALDGGSIDPLSAREQIRAQGPSVRVRRPD